MTKTVRRHIKFPDTPRFNKLYESVAKMTNKNDRLTYADYDPSLGEPPTEEQKIKLQEYKPNLPTLTFVGSEKLHGENMAICYSEGEMWVQGRRQVRTLLGDQNGMAHFVEERKKLFTELFMQIITELFEGRITNKTIVLDAEWAGGNIQKGNAACSGTDKAVYLFDYFRIVDNITEEVEFVSTLDLHIQQDVQIYKMADFGKYTIQLDFNKPKQCEEQLNELALKIEEHSPIAEYFKKPDNVGEGVYLYSEYKEELLRLKAKGEKHGGKPKQPREPKQKLTDEQTKALLDLADKVTPVWRITQGITETNATEVKHVGALIGWVIQDIKKEEVLTKSELSNISRYVAQITKDYYFNSLKGY